MKKKVFIEETISQEFEIEVPEGMETEEVAVEKYKAGELVVTNIPYHRLVAAAQEDGQAGDWREF